jgi:hypothetical protein
MLLVPADDISLCSSGTTNELGPSEAATTDEVFREEYLGTRFSLPAH